MLAKYAQRAPYGIVGRCWRCSLIDGQPGVDAESCVVFHVCHILFECGRVLVLDISLRQTHFMNIIIPITGSDTCDVTGYC